MSKEHTITYNSITDMPEMVISESTMLWNHTGSWRYIKPRYQDKVPPCNQGCPAGNDIENFIGLIHQGKILDAYKVLKEENPFPRTCGRVCYHPCESVCNRSQLDKPVAISALERFAGDQAAQDFKVTKLRPDSNKKVAIIGAGPCGLTAAYHLARLGHQVTVYESLAHPGGLLRYGIPEYRLPKAVLDEEIQDILDLDVDIQCRTLVGIDVTWDSLKKFNAILIATGVHMSRQLAIENECCGGVIPGLKFLQEIAEGKQIPLGPRTVVLGGGNTAIDAARTALRLGSEATIFYHRTRAEMPAFAEELEEAEKEGVKFKILAQPVKIILEDGKLKGIEMRQTQLGDPDESGRRRPVPIPNSEYTVAASTIITAVGETANLKFLPDGFELEYGKLQIDRFGLTNHAGVFAGGDVARSEQNVACAIGSGKAASIAIDAYLNGNEIKNFSERLIVGSQGAVSLSSYVETGNAHGKNRGIKKVVPIAEINLNYFEKFERTKIPKLKISERLHNFKEVHQGLTRSASVLESNRCFHCGVCTMCDNCYVFCPDVSIMHKGDTSWGYEINYDFCKGCGICVKECPRSAMLMEAEK